jgi:hypothetical protein
MDEPNLPSPPTEVRKESPLGIASFILSIVSLGLAWLFFTTHAAFGPLGILFIGGVVLFTLIGLVLGFIAVTNPDQKKVFGILGLLLDSLLIIGSCLSILLNANITIGA